MPHTYDLIKIVGSPFIEKTPDVQFDVLEELFDRAFADRVALLYLTMHRKVGWPAVLEEKYLKLNDRRNRTLEVVADLGQTLNRLNRKGYAVFKSLKPYPATPNDTDVIIFGNKEQFKAALDHLYSENYLFHEWAPMQTTLIHPLGKGKTGKGKKGGTYYIDMYSDISTDYFLYIDKRSLMPYVEDRDLNGVQIRNVRKEVELGVTLFHNVFPERTFQLEHFYMPLYHLNDDDFDLRVLITFAEEQKLSHAIATNLTLVEYIHKKLFNFAPAPITSLLDGWGRNTYELSRFIASGEETPHMFSPRTFWITFSHKLKDPSALRSLLLQGLHMLNPVFFADVTRSLKNRFSEKGTYQLE